MMKVMIFLLLFLCGTISTAMAVQNNINEAISASNSGKNTSGSNTTDDSSFSESFYRFITSKPVKKTRDLLNEWSEIMDSGYFAPNTPEKMDNYLKNRMWLFFKGNVKSLIRNIGPFVSSVYQELQAIYQQKRMVFQHQKDIARMNSTELHEYLRKELNISQEMDQKEQKELISSWQMFLKEQNCQGRFDFFQEFGQKYTRGNMKYYDIEANELELKEFMIAFQEGYPFPWNFNIQKRSKMMVDIVKNKTRDINDSDWIQHVNLTKTDEKDPLVFIDWNKTKELFGVDLLEKLEAFYLTSGIPKIDTNVTNTLLLSFPTMSDASTSIINNSSGDNNTSTRNIMDDDDEEEGLREMFGSFLYINTSSYNKTNWINEKFQVVKAQFDFYGYPSIVGEMDEIFFFNLQTLLYGKKKKAQDVQLDIDEIDLEDEDENVDIEFKKAANSSRNNAASKTVSVQCSMDKICFRRSSVTVYTPLLVHPTILVDTIHQKKRLSLIEKSIQIAFQTESQLVLKGLRASSTLWKSALDRQMDEFADALSGFTLDLYHNESMTSIADLFQQVKEQLEDGYNFKAKAFSSKMPYYATVRLHANRIMQTLQEISIVDLKQKNDEKQQDDDDGDDDAWSYGGYEMEIDAEEDDNAEFKVQQNSHEDDGLDHLKPILQLTRKCMDTLKRDIDFFITKRQKDPMHIALLNHSLPLALTENIAYGLQLGYGHLIVLTNSNGIKYRDYKIPDSFHLLVRILVRLGESGFMNAKEMDFFITCMVLYWNLQEFFFYYQCF